MSPVSSAGGQLRLVAVVLAVLGLVGHSAFCPAEDQKAVTRRPQGAVVTEVGLGDLYAVVVGVSKYKHSKIPQLAVSDKDAGDFAEFLKKQTGLFKKAHITLLTNENATKQALETQLFYKLRKAGKDDTVLVFLSGHGADDPNTPGEFFFLTYDADPELLAVTAVHMNRQWFLTKLESKRIVLIADACHAGGFSGSTKALRRSRENLLQIFKESEGKIFITSSRPDQLSIEKPEYGHSLFTHYLLEGLAGKADQDGDGVVTLRELYEYVYKKTHEESRGNQSPQMEGTFVGAFPIALASVHPSPVMGTEPASASQPVPSELDALRAKAEQGDPGAQFKLGLLLEFGINVATDKAEAIKWYQRAADKGLEDAKKAMARLQPGPPISSASAPPSLPQETVPPRPRQRDDSLDFQMMVAAGQGDVEKLELLISRGADVHATYERGQTMLMYAARRDQVRAIKYLISQGADVNAKDPDGETALIKAAYIGALKTMKLLIYEGADVKAKNKDGETAMMRAAQGGEVETMEFLISKGLDVHAKDKEGRTALFAAVRGDSVKAMRFLVSRRLDVNARDEDGKTPLMEAAELGKVEAVKFLISKGAQVTAENKYGDTALKLANTKRKTEAAALLRKHGAR